MGQHRENKRLTEKDHASRPAGRRGTRLGLVALPVLFLLGSACGDDSEPSSSPSADRVGPREETGTVGSYTWSLRIETIGGQRCVLVDISPSILGASDLGQDIDKFLDQQLWDPPACTSGPSIEWEQFGPVFGPYVFISGYDLPVVAGLVADGVENLTVETQAGSHPVRTFDNGGFILFPDSAPTQLTLEVDGAPYECPIESTATPGGMTVGDCVANE